MRRLVPVAVALLLASCAAATTTSEGSSTSTARPQSAGAPDDRESPSIVLPSPTVPVAAPTDNANASVLGARIASAKADFDCDGLPDTLEFFNAPRPGSYLSLEAGKLARLTRSWGGVLELPFDGMPGDDPGRNPIIGVADVNGDSCDDVIVNVGHGASTTLAAFLVFDGTRLKEVAENGDTAIFVYEGSVRHGSGIECRTSKGVPEIVSRAVSDYTSDFQWDVVERVYRWPTPSTLSLYSTAKSVIRVANAYEQPPDFARYWGLSCGSLNTPSWAFTR
jgi:hypothetical protein